VSGEIGVTGLGRRKTGDVSWIGRTGEKTTASLFVASFVASFVDKAPDKARDKA
jgi:hypothetical protein